MAGEWRSTIGEFLQSTRGRTTTVLVLLGVQAGLIAYSATRHSPTHLEPALLAAGVSHWETGRFELYRVNPPLVRMVAALPAVISGCKTDWTRYRDAPGSRSEFEVGEDFVKANASAAMRLFINARWACIPFAWIGSYFAYRWSREMYGPFAGLLTLWLWVFEPNLLAHAELITSDSACASLGVACGYWFYRWLQEPNWKHAGFAGVFLGLAQLSKLSWLFLFGLWPVLWFIWRCSACNSRTSLSQSTSTRPPALQLALILATALYVINLGYAFDGTGTKLKDFEFVSSLLNGKPVAGRPGNRFRESIAGEVRVPVPKQYLLGFDSQKKDFEVYHPASYLHGTWKHGGWWYYYLYGMLVKVPCGTLVLLAWCGCCHFIPRINQHREQWSPDYLIWAPAICLLLIVSSQTEFNHHLRYAFPALGLMFVWLGQLAPTVREPGEAIPKMDAPHKKNLTPRNRVRILATIALAFFSAVSACSAYPHHLAYFNELSGGGISGSKHITHSSLDWGQDSVLLHEWFASHIAQHPDSDLVICAAPWWDATATTGAMLKAWSHDYETLIRFSSRENPLKHTHTRSTVFAVSVNRLLIQPDSLAERFPVESCECIGAIGYTTLLYRISDRPQFEFPVHISAGGVEQ
ncbi:MAG: glycosyltransferase family 39 protein [Planctomycetes bacterium]|nr:glycosyltransferase family 39 protein [Planctomycetota bacterium]